ncbi:EspB family ESX-1 secretion system-associated protein [Mycobacterium camsae]|uniref:PPE domain-containing protein n=1 Tax=Mycobacterium gordonae TaxID=1778 RepID=UPI00197F7C29|nr:hypothetical protein [Mycobacterium gordonae]
MAQTLKVEYEELMARADEIEQPIPRVPSVNPQAPCRLQFVDDSAVQIALSADAMRLYLRAGEREWKKLATSLRNAAKAYESVDDGSAAALNTVAFDGSGTTAGAAADNQMSVVCDPDEDFGGALPPPPAPPPFQFPYYEVREAATLITTGDAGQAYEAFAAEWDAFQRALQAETYRFRPFNSWEGASQIAVEANFDAQRQWIYSMSALCANLSQQVLRVVDAHKKASVYGQHGTWDQQGNRAVPAEHPTTYEVSQCDYWYRYYVSTNSPYLSYAIEWYEELQAQSETSLQLYTANAGIPLPPVIPATPPGAFRIAPPADTPDPDTPNPGDVPDGVTPTPDVPAADDLSGSSLSDLANTTTPFTGMPGGMSPPPQNDPKLTEAIDKLGKATGGAAVNPAGLGGSGGGAGLPKMPLGAAAGTAGAGPAAAAAGRTGLDAVISGSAGRGGAGVGGMPMGGAPGGQGKDGKQGKRVGSEDEALYTEERAWTGGVIGRRRTKDDGDQAS